jgi:hypothetical protein
MTSDEGVQNGQLGQNAQPREPLARDEGVQNPPPEIAVTHNAAFPTAVW